MKKLGLILTSLVVLSFPSLAQLGYYNDALLFSRTNFGGTARMQAIGGAQVSLGGDISSAQSNPAGLGFYNRSEFSFTPGLSFQKSKASLDGGLNQETFSAQMDISNLGLVFNNKGDGSIKSWSFGISVNKVNDFNREVEYNDYANSSILESFAQRAAGVEPGDFEQFIDNPFSVNVDPLLAEAWNQFLIIEYFDNGVPYYDPLNLVEVTPGLVYSNPRLQETITTSGGQYQWNFSGGGNFNDKLYFGASLGFLTVRYERISEITETEMVSFDEASIGDVTLVDELDIFGNGINATFGMIVRPINLMTIGVSYQTPTFYGLTDESSFTLSSFIPNNIDFRNIPGEPGLDVPSGEGSSSFNEVSTSNYQIITPSRLNVGATVFVGKQGFLSGDVEFVDYSDASIRSDDFFEADDNNEIQLQYKSAINYRLGGEYRLDILRFRAGYAFQANPYDSDLKRSSENLTFGMGLKKKKYFVDLGVVNSKMKDYYSPYVLADGSEPLVDMTVKNTKFLVTVGFSF